MTIEACIKCSNMNSSIEFYTKVLDFNVLVTPDPDPSSFMSKYALLERGGSSMHLSAHEGDGVFGNLVYVRTDAVEALYEQVISQGISSEDSGTYPALTIPLVEQSWGMKEFSVRDPDGNKITFGQSLSG